MSASKWKTPCEELAKASLKCQEDNPHQKQVCQDAIDMYKECRRQWVCGASRAAAMIGTSQTPRLDSGWHFDREGPCTLVYGNCLVLSGRHSECTIAQTRVPLTDSLHHPFVSITDGATEGGAEKPGKGRVR